MTMRKKMRVVMVTVTPIVIRHLMSDRRVSHIGSAVECLDDHERICFGLEQQHVWDFMGSRYLNLTKESREVVRYVAIRLTWLSSQKEHLDRNL